MLTRCPTCQTTFHVSAEQLKARQGRVRCGHCQGVFNALATLVEETPPAPPAPPAAEHVVFQGFEMPSVEAASQVSSVASPAVAEPPPAAPVAPLAAATAEGEEVAEPSVEFVEIGDLSLDEIVPEASSLAAEESVEDMLTRTEIDIPPLGDFDLGEPEEPEEAIEPPPEEPYTKTVVGFTWYVEPEPPAPAPVAEPAEPDMTKTVVQSVRIEPPRQVEPIAMESAAAEPTPALRPAPHFEPPAVVDDSDFAKTVVQSIRMFEPVAPAVAAKPAPAIAKPTADEFTKTTIQPRSLAEAAAPKEPPAPVFSFPSIEPLTVEEAGPSALAKGSANDEFARTVVEVPPMAPPAAEDLTDNQFDLGPIDDIHVEETPELPSITELSKLAPTAYPTLPPLAQGEELPAGQSANAILEQLAASPATATEWPGEQAEASIQPPVQADETETIPLRKAERALRAVAEVTSPAVEADIEPAPAVVHAIPELQELPTRRRWPWVLGSLLALVALSVQAVVYYRVELSVLIPRSKPALVALCDALDCKVSLPSQIDLIGIETSDLSPGPEGAGQLQLAATLRNRAPFVQAWPDLELTLTDNADKALVRRVLTPVDYLPPAHKASAGFPARSEQTVYLDLKAPGVPAVGYRLYVFYP